MKTRQEVEQIKIKVQKELESCRDSAQKAYNESNFESFNYHDREYAKRVAQHNILLEVLQ